jgi:hypothetical protein
MVIGSLLLAWGVAVLVEAATTTATATYFGYIPTVVIGAIATAVVGYRMWKAP